MLQNGFAPLFHILEIIRMSSRVVIGVDVLVDQKQTALLEIQHIQLDSDLMNSGLDVARINPLHERGQMKDTGM